MRQDEPQVERRLASLRGEPAEEAPLGQVLQNRIGAGEPTLERIEEPRELGRAALPQELMHV